MGERIPFIIDMEHEKRRTPCNACYACMETHSCVIKDDMAEIFSRLVYRHPSYEQAYEAGKEL